MIEEEAETKNMCLKNSKLRTITKEMLLVTVIKISQHYDQNKINHLQIFYIIDFHKIN